MRVEITDGDKTYHVIAKGDVMTIYDPKTRKYAQMPARSTPSQDYGVLVGLMSVETEVLNFVTLIENIAARHPGIKIAADGAGNVRGDRCDRFNIMETSGTVTKKWDVWLANTEPRLPCKFIASSTEDLAQFSQTNEFTWKPTPVVAADAFVFTPPAGAKEVAPSGLGLRPPAKAWQ